jgi:hypothetical protein
MDIVKFWHNYFMPIFMLIMIGHQRWENMMSQVTNVVAKPWVNTFDFQWIYVRVSFKEFVM